MRIFRKKFLILFLFFFCNLAIANILSQLDTLPGVFAYQFLQKFPSQFLKPYPLQKPNYYGKHLCANPGFHCYVVQKGDTWENLFPDKTQRDYVKRLNRINAALYYRKWILVPNGFYNLNRMDLSPFPEKVKPRDGNFIVVNLSNYSFTAYNKFGYQVYWGPAAPGMDICTDTDTSCVTHTGDFRIFKKGDVNCRSDSFPVGSGGSPMPYCMYFNGGAALHGAYFAGLPNSHGCVQLFPKDAAWLNLSFVKAGYPGGTEVIVVKHLKDAHLDG